MSRIPHPRLDRSLSRRRPAAACRPSRSSSASCRTCSALIANSPAALEGYLGLNGALAKGTLEAQTRERIALAVAEVNGCDYCLSAHTYLGKNLAKLTTPRSPPTATAAQRKRKPTPRSASPSRSSQSRGHVSEADVKAVKAAGYTDAQVIEIVLHVALNTLTNYVNEMVKTEIDFPVVTANAARRAA